MTSVDVAAIRARWESAEDARNTAAYNAQYGIGVGSSQYDRAAASARDVPALLSALGVAEARAQEAEAALERVKALHPRHECNYTGDDATCPDGDECEWIYCAGCEERWPCPTIAALHGVPSQPQGDQA